ncbi:hypothetical protein CsSME_00020973 [Camellia sinensis var. sinensis]
MGTSGKIEFYGDFNGSFHKSLDLGTDGSLDKSLDLGIDLKPKYFTSVFYIFYRNYLWSEYVVDEKVKVLNVEKAPS